jgi:ATPase subunit of ABC transporter with duplicated ATPase domains
MATTPFLLRARSLAVDTGDRLLFADLDLTLTERIRAGVVGANGSGKSTLLRLLAGERRPTRGTISRAPATATVALVPQEPDRSTTETARAYLGRRTGVTAADGELQAAAAALAEDLDDRSVAERYDRALDVYDRVGCADHDERAAEVTTRVGLAPDRLDRTTATLSGGEAARLSLAAVLLAHADLLLLDEPTNDLDQQGLALLEELVATTASGLVVVSHDRAFLESTVTSVIELGPEGSELFDGGWEAFLAERAARRRLAEVAYRHFDDERQRLTDQARRERAWSQEGVRRVKTSGETDKFVRFGAKQGAENGGRRAARTERALARLGTVDKPWEGWDLRFSIAPASRSGRAVARLDDVVVRRGARRFGPWHLEIEVGDRLALVGPNGSGKTTLIEVLTGRHPTEHGSVVVGPSVVIGELRQQRVEAASTGELLGWFLEQTGQTTSEGRSLLAKFGLTAEHLDRPPTSLSTGERTRAELALFQARGVNLMILDEPTNHLDLEAIEQLEQALATYPGTLVVVSHDRRFLENVELTRTFELGPTRLAALNQKV